MESAPTQGRLRGHAHLEPVCPSHRTMRRHYQADRGHDLDLGLVEMLSGNLSTTVQQGFEDTDVGSYTHGVNRTKVRRDGGEAVLRLASGSGFIPALVCLSTASSPLVNMHVVVLDRKSESEPAEELSALAVVCPAFDAIPLRQIAVTRLERILSKSIMKPYGVSPINMRHDIDCNHQFTRPAIDPATLQFCPYCLNPVK
ncbi:hypothetical protein F4777DRAFT_582854 [Nemania sp. FL0916]|nr:hypothetical protein F4777DRAFT_582854 [Nemania sp. FL0916]